MAPVIYSVFESITDTGNADKLVNSKINGL